MDYLVDYHAIVSREVLDDSFMLALLPGGVPKPEPAFVANALATLPELRDVRVGSPKDDGTGWILGFEADGARIMVGVGPTRHELLGLESHRFTKGQETAVIQSDWSVALSMTLGEEPLSGFHKQVRLLAALAPDAVAVHDRSARLLHSGDWMRDLVASAVPPSLQSLFSLHMVGEAQGDDCWLHTHGLLRCGCLELEALDVPAEGTGLVSQLIQAVASMFLDELPPAPRTPFLVGKGLELVWMPWQEGSRKAKPVQRGEEHSYPTATLFTVRKRLLRGPAYEGLGTLLPTLSADPVFYISPNETRRMSMLARERLEQFLALQSEHGATEDWNFLVKLGLPAGDQLKEKEHLWFLVHAIEGGEVDATLMNEPHKIRDLTKGQRARHALEPLSDWLVSCPRGSFGPEDVFEVIRPSEIDPRLH